MRRSTCSCRCRWTSAPANGPQNSRLANLYGTLPLARRLLLPLVFVSGMASLGVEFGASRLLAPYFGTSLYVWGVLIGLILVYLSAGNVIGGRLPDRYPRGGILFQITAWAGPWIRTVPVLGHVLLPVFSSGVPLPRD